MTAVSRTFQQLSLLCCDESELSAILLLIIFISSLPFLLQLLAAPGHKDHSGFSAALRYLPVGVTHIILPPDCPLHNKHLGFFCKLIMIVRLLHNRSLADKPLFRVKFAGRWAGQASLTIQPSYLKVSAITAQNHDFPVTLGPQALAC